MSVAVKPPRTFCATCLSRISALVAYTPAFARAEAGLVTSRSVRLNPCSKETSSTKAVVYMHVVAAKTLHTFARYALKCRRASLVGGKGIESRSSSRAQYDPADFIRANLPIVPVPSIPEIRLHKAGPRSGLWRLAARDQEFGSPYWAHYWGGGLALARHILDQRDVVAGRSVLDLGAGSGIVAIAAAKAGAREVIAADIDRYAVAATGLNAAENNVAVSAFLGDPTEAPPLAVDIVAVGDLFYERDLAKRVTAFLDQCLESGSQVLIGDPWRAFLPRSRLRLLGEYPISEFGDLRTGEAKPAAVFSFERDVDVIASTPA
jgi:predicted nicotinamide N-methyase